MDTALIFKLNEQAVTLTETTTLLPFTGLRVLPEFARKIELMYAKLIRVTDTGCHEFTGRLTHNGYGQFKGHRGKCERAHRYVNEATFGPIPTGIVVDHLCRNRKCVNPMHHERVTGAENTARIYQPELRGEEWLKFA